MRFLYFPLCLLLLATPQLKAAPPNIVIILADDMGYSDLGCYGGEIATPNLDGLAKNGVRFTQFYNTARCWPSRAALMTGYYPQQIHRDALPDLPGGNQGTRPKWAKLLPERLQKIGYRNYHSGKWHIDGDVLAGGFDRSLHTRNDGNFFTAKGNLIDDKPVVPAEDESGYYVTTATAEHAIACLKDHAANYSDKPFLHYLPFIAPHFPLHAKEEDIAKYRDRYLQGWDLLRQARHTRQRELGLVTTALSTLEREVGPPYHFPDAFEKLGPGEINRPLPWTELTDEQRRFQATKMAIHAAMIDRMDQEIGRYLEQLRSMGAYENTLIFVASDNGASAEIMVRHGGHDPMAPPGSEKSYLCLGPGFSSAANTPFRRHKTWVHEGGISTPLIVHWPQGISAANELRHTPGHLIDLVPTILEATGLADNVEQERRADVAEQIPPFAGRSLLSTIISDQPVDREFLWWLHEGNRAVRVGDWKLVAAKGDPWELYNLAGDRAEQTNLAAQNPDKVKELAAAWQKQTDGFTELAKLTQPPQAKQGTKGKKKAKN
ncbi:MAG: arylsulfatase [Planctomycetaceae bacterium]